MPNHTPIYDLKEVRQVPEEEFLLLGYWVDREAPNKEMLELMKSLKGRHIATFGTLGDYTDSDHARAVKAKVAELLVPDNVLLGNFLCQGKIDPKITEMFKKAAESAGRPHQMTPERLKKHEEEHRTGDPGRCHQIFGLRGAAVCP
jgi:hypothetical protein